MQICPECSEVYPDQQQACPEDGSALEPLGVAPYRAGSELSAGSVIAGRYRIEGVLGTGAMGAVYRAAQIGLERPVALKVLKKDLSWGPDAVERFRREARAMSALTHPNTVRVFDFGATESGLLYLAMELLEGENITDRLQRDGVLDVEDAIQWTQQVLRSIHEAHAKGIIHRDIKPDNVFLATLEGASEPIVKVLDFGIAKATEGERKIDQFETLDGTVFGTPRYMSPEQAQGRALDPRSDLYSVGIVLYEFLTGSAPFVEDDAVVVMARHIRDDITPLRQAAPQQPIPASLERVMRRALAKNSDDRFQSAEEFDRALETCLPDVQAFRRRSSLLPPAARPHARRWLWGTATALSLCAGLFFGWQGLSTTQGPMKSSHSEASGARPASPSNAFAAADVSPASDPQDAPRPSEAEPPPPEPDEPEVEMVMVHSRPDEATVWHRGDLLGVTPLAVMVPRDSSMIVELRKEGFVSSKARLTPTDEERRIDLERRVHRQRQRRRRPQRQRTAPDPQPEEKIEHAYERFD